MLTTEDLQVRYKVNHLYVNETIKRLSRLIKPYVKTINGVDYFDEKITEVFDRLEVLKKSHDLYDCYLIILNNIDYSIVRTTHTSELENYVTINDLLKNHNIKNRPRDTINHYMRIIESHKFVCNPKDHNLFLYHKSFIPVFEKITSNIKTVDKDELNKMIIKHNLKVIDIKELVDLLGFSKSILNQIIFENPELNVYVKKYNKYSRNTFIRYDFKIVEHLKNILYSTNEKFLIPKIVNSGSELINYVTINQLIEEYNPLNLSKKTIENRLSSLNVGYIKDKFTIKKSQLVLYHKSFIPIFYNICKFGSYHPLKNEDVIRYPKHTLELIDLSELSNLTNLSFKTIHLKMKLRPDLLSYCIPLKKSVFYDKKLSNMLVGKNIVQSCIADNISEVDIKVYNLKPTTIKLKNKSVSFFKNENVELKNENESLKLEITKLNQIITDFKKESINMTEKLSKVSTELDVLKNKPIVKLVNYFKN